jgi:hypothetical protein
VQIEFLIKHYKDSEGKFTSKAALLAANHTTYVAFNKYYELSDDVLVHAAAVLLHSDYQFGRSAGWRVSHASFSKFRKAYSYRRELHFAQGIKYLTDSPREFDPALPTSSRYVTQTRYTL